jgi:hypothetical protein
MTQEELAAMDPKRVKRIIANRQARPGAAARLRALPVLGHT